MRKCRTSAMNGIAPENPKDIIASVGAACLAVAVMLGIPYILGLAKMAGWF